MSRVVVPPLWREGSARTASLRKPTSWTDSCRPVGQGGCTVKPSFTYRIGAATNCFSCLLGQEYFRRSCIMRQAKKSRSDSDSVVWPFGLRDFGLWHSPAPAVALV